MVNTIQSSDSRPDSEKRYQRHLECWHCRQTGVDVLMLQVDLAGLGSNGTGDAGEGAVQDGTPFVSWTSVLIVVLFTEEGTQGRLKTW